jgi:aminopeptidase N
LPSAIADANPDSALARLLPQFKRWYSQAGTPRVTLSSQYDAQAQTCTLQLHTELCRQHRGRTAKLPFVIPINLGLVGSDGTVLALQAAGLSGQTLVTTTCLS